MSGTGWRWWKDSNMNSVRSSKQVDKGSDSDREQSDIKASLEENFQADVHLHKDVHRIDEKQDRIETDLRLMLSAMAEGMGEMHQRLSRIERILETLGSYLNELPSKLNRDP